MIYNLSHDEVMKVCSACANYAKDDQCCRVNPLNVKPLKEMHRCKKWDEFFGGPSIYNATT